MLNQIMKLKSTITGIDQRSYQQDQPLDIQLSTKTTFNKRELSPQPLKPIMEDFPKQPGVRSPIKIKMTQLSPKKIQETPSDAKPNRSKSSLPYNTFDQDQGTLNSAIYQKLFQKFNERTLSPSSNNSSKRQVDIKEVYQLRKEMMEKYDKHVQSKRRLSAQNQNLKLMLKSKTEREPTKIGTFQEQIIEIEQKKLSKNEIQDFLLRVERSQEKKERGVFLAEIQKSQDAQKWQILPKSKIIVSKSLDRHASQQAMSLIGQRKPLFDAFNFPKQLTKSISRTEFKTEQPEFEQRQQNFTNTYDSTIQFKQQQSQANQKSIVGQALNTQQSFVNKFKKKINKIFKKKLDLITTSDDQIDMGVLLKLLGAITTCTVEKRLVPNHAYVQQNTETLILTILDLQRLDLFEESRASQFIINKFLSEDRVKSAAKLVAISEPLNLSYAQQRRIQQHFEDFAVELRKRRLQKIKYRSALASPKRSNVGYLATDSQVQPFNVQYPIIQNSASKETHKGKREQFLDKIIDRKDKAPDSQIFSQKRYTQADLRSVAQTQLETRKNSPHIEKSSRKSVNQKSRNTPVVYSLATENLIKTTQKESKLEIAQLLYQSQNKRSSLKRPKTKTTVATPILSPRQPRNQWLFESTSTIVVQNNNEKNLPISRKSSKSPIAITKNQKQPLTQRPKQTLTATLYLENRTPLFVTTQTQEVLPSDINKNQVLQEVKEAKDIQLIQQNEQITHQNTQSPKSLSIDINLPNDHALLQSQDQVDDFLQKSLQGIETKLTKQNFDVSDSKVSLIESQQSFRVKQNINEEKALSQQQLQICQQVQDTITNLQLLPSENRLQNRESEPITDQQSRPSEIINDIDLLNRAVEARSKHLDSGAELLSDSGLSQNQGQQIEEQGAKEQEISIREYEDINMKNEPDVKSVENLDKSSSNSSLNSVKDQINQQKSNKSIGSIESDHKSEKINEQLQQNDQDRNDQNLLDRKFTITDIRNSELLNENQTEVIRPKFMTFSQPSQDNEDQHQAMTQEANDSIKAILQALNQTIDGSNPADLEIDTQKQIVGSEQGKNLGQLDQMDNKNQVSPKSETAFERYQRQKRENQLNVSSPPSRENNNFSDSKKYSKTNLNQARYVPKYASPNSDQKSNQRSWHSEVQVETLQLNEDQLYILKNQYDKVPTVEKVIVISEKEEEKLDQQLQIIQTQKDPNKNIKILSFAEDLNLQNLSSQEKANQDIASIQDQVQQLEIEKLTSNNSQQDIQNTSIVQELVQDSQNLLISVEDINKPQEEIKVQQSVHSSQKELNQVRNSEALNSSARMTLRIQSLKDLKLPDPIDEPQVQVEKEIESSVAPKQTLQSQFQAIKSGIFQFMSKKTKENDEKKQDQQPSQAANVYNKVSNLFNRVQDNIKDQVKEKQISKPVEIKPEEQSNSKTSQLLQPVNEMFKKVKDNVNQSSIQDVFKGAESVKQQITALNDKVQQQLPINTQKIIPDFNQTDKLDALKQKLPNVDMLSKAVHELKENQILNKAINAAESRFQTQLSSSFAGNLIQVAKQTFSSEKSKIVDGENINCVDKMAAVLDKLDLQFEEELRNIPQPQAKQKSNQRNQKEQDKLSNTSQLQQKRIGNSSSSSKRQKSDSKRTPSKNYTPMKKAKSDLKDNHQRVQTTANPDSKLQTQQKITQSRQTYHAYPKKIVDAPEMMFFSASWFQIRSKKSKN